jgi:spoIIIJ-associated protein
MSDDNQDTLDTSVSHDDQQRTAESLESAIAYAKKFLEDLLSFFGLNTDVYATTNDDEIIELHVPSTHLNGFLIGQHGETIRAIQFMTSTALRNNKHAYTRVHVDIADYKKQRAERLSSRAEDWVKEVKGSGKEMHLRPMNSADRRLVHKLASDSGLETESVGEGRDRHVVLKLANGSDSSDKPTTKEAEPEA